MSWTAEQERQFLEMQAQREEVLLMHRTSLDMALKESGLNPTILLVLPLEKNAARIIKALEPFAALKEQE